MKQFNLQEYLKNPNKKVITRDGKSVRIICTNRLDETYQVIALVNNEGSERCFSYTTLGRYVSQKNRDCELDLFFAPEKKSGWINVCRGCGEYNTYVCNRIFATKEEAESAAGGYKSYYIATIKIEWEE